ncbi:hypothetical protein [Bartonella schoenbuchensis]|uniref:Uncharacterized protein n=1 Tax=Bartonella schoenbuchensis m07a TaxID=1094496 RepID=N6UH36_9HYPH|nr:hypothetical protein [Bartonella schoenbuchensis]ENN91824.1 hypothetical protein m07a_07090 [Bartonella schoenbuchensis m07a]
MSEHRKNVSMLQKYLTIILDASAVLLEIVMDVCQIRKKVEQRKQTEESLKAVTRDWK